MHSLDDLLKIANPIRAFALKNYSVTAHPDEVLQIPSRDKGRFIRIHAYNTLNRVTPTPVLVNFHGSGFVNPLHGSDDEFCKYIVKETGFAVLDCSYRLSPENKFPAPVHDAEDAVRWVLSHPEKFDASQLSISGFSAGGILSLVLSSVVFPQGTFKNVLAAYPPTDMIQENKEKIAPDTSLDPAPVELLDAFIQCYYPSPEDVKSVLASPAVIPAEKFSDRIFIATAACDRLCIEGEALGNRIRNETTKHVKMHRYEGCEHAFDKAYEKGSVQERAKDDLYERAATFLTE
ncbi:Alpha/Beta hydrolase protein [Aspergillus falconensis]